MQTLHHHQQQLAALLAAALPTDGSPAPNTGGSCSDEAESARIAAVESLHCAIVFPHNAILLSHSATFLAQGFAQLLSDKSYSVRQAAATTYGALCAVLCSMPVTPNARQNHALLGSLVDRFIGWALPLLNNAIPSDGTTELALDSLLEFLNAGDVGAIERFALPILKACQVLLEDERTSMSLLHQLLGMLTLISLKFSRTFQPHFLDIVDLLLGWALVPDLAESDRRIIMNSFLQFQNHWVLNLQFSLGLISKFLGDMDALLHDGIYESPQQFRRLLALLSCFSSVLQSTASGLLEMNLLEQISDPLRRMVPPLLNCLSMVGQNFGWSEWVTDLWRCLTLLAEILGESFSTFYTLSVDIIFQSLEMNVASFQVHGVLKTNLQLLSLQKLGLLPSAVKKVLQFDAPVSQLRLHPNHLVTGSSAATYIFVLQHGNDEVVQQALTMLIEELEMLKGMLGRSLGHTDTNSNAGNQKPYSNLELLALVKFDLRVLLTSVLLEGSTGLLDKPDVAALYLRRSETLLAFIVQKLFPFDLPIQSDVELQVSVIKTMDRLSEVEFLSKCSARNKESDGLTTAIGEHIRKYSVLIESSLRVSSPLAVKVVALAWIQRFSETVISICSSSSPTKYFDQEFGYVSSINNVLISVLNATSDREPRVRTHVALVLKSLLQARLVHPMHFYDVAEVVLEKLGDPDNEIKNAFVGLLSHVIPATIYACGLQGYDTMNRVLRLGNNSNLHWKQVFALKKLHHQLHAQQLVSILSYISQRWKVPLSSWIQRLVHRCRNLKDPALNKLEETGNTNANAMWLDVIVDEDILEKNCSVNNLAGAWWAIHEATRYCVAMRLRTNLGGPTQTFAALERTLLDIAHLLQLDSEQNDGNLSMIGASGAQLLPMRLFLDFVEALKKNVYNAYEGSVSLPMASRSSTLFFRANKKVCEEWFSRICEPMMSAGLALQCHDATIHYCVLRLHELRNLATLALKEKSRPQISDQIHIIKNKFSTDVSRVLRHMALALCKSRESEALIGLLRWVSMTFSSLFGDESQTLNGETLGPFSWIIGLVYQAKGQYEKGIAHFSLLLQSEESLNSMGSDGVQFVIARMIEGYTAVCDWKSLESWLIDLQSLRAKHAGKSYSGALTATGNEINAVHALSNYDEGDFGATWAYLDLTPKSSSELTLDPKLALHRSEQMLLQAMLLQKEGKEEMVDHQLRKAKSMLEEYLAVLPLDGLREAAPYAIQLHCISVFEDSYKLRSSQDRSTVLLSMLSSYLQSMQYVGKIYEDCGQWLKVLRVYQNILPASPVTLKLCTDLLSLARKKSNPVMASRLRKYLDDHIPSCSEERYRDFFLSFLQFEDIMLLKAENKFEDALTSLWSFIYPCFVSLALQATMADGDILKAKACLKFSSWLGQSYSNPSLNKIIPSMLADFKASFGDENLDCVPSLSLVIEEMVGTATKLSTRLCPTMGKSWISYASWCFRQAQDSFLNPQVNAFQKCFFSLILTPEVPSDSFNLTKDENTSIQSLILQRMSSHDELGEHGLSLNSEQVSDLVQQVVNILEALAGEISNDESLSAILSSQLNNCFQRSNIGLKQSEISSLVGDLVEIWWSLRRRRVCLFGHAAFGFIQYLSYSSANIDGQLEGFGYESSKQKNGQYTLRATLYILHILLNYGVELKETLESALSSVPLAPWQEVTPQLFARLTSHPEKVIRNQLEGLLIMLAKQSPSAIVYPTLVDVNGNEEKPPQELQHILNCLSELYPRLVQDVQLMINDLENVTVLWEELWLGTLQDLHTDVMRRINLLKEEVSRIAENFTLSQSEKSKINAAKYSAMMAPVVVALERRLASTSRDPVTPHEVFFHKEYKEQLKSAITTFKNPPTSASALGDVWRSFDSIAASLASYQRKSSISLGEVAPQLSVMSSSDVPMPGLEKHDSVVVTIASFAEQVEILTTKTKPKKLVILGSDGKKYRYLLKGREDLRLDARIMQLLQAINGFLRSSSVTHSQSLGVRYYSVTPISGRAGLIQWVDNVVSIYSVFKSWQSRMQVAQLSATAGGNTKSTVPPPVPRPSDMFYGKIIPALKEKGIRRVISRRDWPHDVKRKVLIELMKETPGQLLHQELWCASEGFKAFSSKLKRYAGSVAAMSMVGHILGLGDRHLDNILVDFCSGDIVHIDYNVCFDKGQRLKVPEIVPFRLTHTIEAALGLTGIEGSFRANCEAVLGVLRKNKDILLMLLEVFVWDPLVEWTRGDFHDEAAIGGEERKGMELAVSLSLFSSRVQEIRVPLQEHHDLLLGALPAVESSLERFADVLNQYELTSALFYQADKERSNWASRESSAKAIVAEATNSSENTRSSYEMLSREFAQAKSGVAEKAKEAATWIEQHGRIHDALRNNIIPGVSALVNEQEGLSLSSAMLVSGVPLTIVPEPTQVQCRDIDREVSDLISELDSGLSSCLASLQIYSLALQRILPLNYVTTSAVHGWAQVLQLSINALSSDTLSLARRQAAEIIAKGHGINLDSIKLTHNDLCLQVERYALEILKLEEVCAELESSIDFGNKSKAKARLLSAFTRYMQSDEHAKHDGKKSEKALCVLNVVVGSLFNEAKLRLENVFGNSTEGNSNSRWQYDFETVFFELEEQVEKCLLVTELRQLISTVTDNDSSEYYSEKNWSLMFKDCLVSCQNLIDQMTEVILPDLMKSAFSSNSEVMDVYGSISQIRGSVESALEQFVEIKLEKTSLVDLEQNYFNKVGLISEKKSSLEEEALKGRDHLSWEEAEELASHEEACRMQLNRLHQAWNHRDAHASSLIKREADVKKGLILCDNQFESLLGGKETLLNPLVKLFTGIELIDRAFSSLGGSFTSQSNELSEIAEFLSSGIPISDCLWKLSTFSDGQSFFVWKTVMVDSFLDTCIHEISSSMDRHLGFDQLLFILKRKLKMQLQEHVLKYLKERVAPTLSACLYKESEHMKHLTEAAKNTVLNQVKKDMGVVTRVQHMLEEHCNAHKAARAAKSTAFLKRKQVKELGEALHRTSIEIFQTEWIHDSTLNPSNKSKTIIQNFVHRNEIDSLYPVVSNLSRPKLLETLQSAVSKIGRSLESLQACERNSINAENQLERAMGWACGGPSSSGTGIPPQFHDHLMKRRKILSEVRERATDVIKFSMSTLEFEASRDGIFLSGADGRMWQQCYLNALTRLDITYHSFSCAEQEWKLAQSNMETASNRLYAATNEFHIASLKAKSASDEFQSTILAMRDSAYEVSQAVTAYGRVSRSHTALTSECGSMLEEVLAITEDLHDIHSMGKEAAGVHRSLMENLSKANLVLLPLETVLAKDVAAMAEALTQEREITMDVYAIHGQAIYQSYRLRINDTFQILKPLVSPLTSSVKGLYSLLTRLAQSASLHAGNLHKALEGLGESEEVKSQGSNLSRSDLGIDAPEIDDTLSVSSGGPTKDVVSGLTFEENGYISPPESICSSDSESDIVISGESGELSQDSRSREASSFEISGPSSQNDSQQIHSEAKITALDDFDSLKLTSEFQTVAPDTLNPLGGITKKRDEVSAMNKIKLKNEDSEASCSSTNAGNRVGKEKNPYALSVLRRVEMKLDGRDITENREISIGEQVDYLLKQATSIDNLCNMYEGWTPWI